MGKLEDRENRRRASVIGPIAGVGPEEPGERKGRPREDRETKKRVSLSVLPSLYEDIQKISYVQRRSISNLVATLLEEYRRKHEPELEEYDRIMKSNIVREVKNENI